MEPYDFGNTLKKYRKRKNLTQEQLARKLEITDGNVSKYEANTSYPTFEKLRALSVILNVSLDELCGTQARETASLYGITEEQSKIVTELIEAFRNKNESNLYDKNLNRYELLGKIVNELMK